MAIKTFTTGEVLTAADTNTYLANSGLVYVASSTFSAVSTQKSFDSVFTSTYKDYVVVCSRLTNSVGGNLYIRMRAGGSDTAGTAYNGFRVESSTAGVASVAAVVASSYWTPTYINTTATSFAEGTLNFYRPQTAEITTMTGKWIRVDGSTGTYGMEPIGALNNTTQYDGFSLIPSSGGTISGTVIIYGVRGA